MTTNKKSKPQPTLDKMGALLIILSIELLTILLIVNLDENQVGVYEALIYGLIGLFLVFGLSVIIFKHRNFITNANKLLEKLIKIIFGPTIVLITILLTFLGLEVTSRIIIKNNPSFRLHRLNASPDYVPETPAYKGADYANEAFFQERFDPRIYIIRDKENDLILPENYSGDFINIVNNRRVTIGHPINAKHTIYLFGGSTIFNIEVPDQYTVASNLQALLNNAYPETYQVENMGVIGLTTGEQLKRLKTLTINEGDIIIFFDGINDIIRNAEYPASGFLKTLDKSFLYKFFLKSYINRWLPKYELPNQPEIEKDYYQNILEAMTYASQNGAEFFHFLQPTIYFVNNPTDYELNLMSSIEKDYPGWQEEITYGYLALYDAHIKLKAEGIASYDLRYIFSHEYRADNVEIFFDDVHVNQIGNQIVATQIFDEINENLHSED